VQTKFAKVLIVGEPNAGKSTLFNYLIGERISIVTHKVQTTRNAIRGILNHGQTQLVFIDTPGIFKPRITNNLERSIVRNATNALAEADILCLLIDARKPLSKETHMIIEMLAAKKEQRPVIAILNKIDLLAKEKLISQAQQLFELGIFKSIPMISARTGAGVEKLLVELRELAPTGGWQYDEDELTDMPTRNICEDITRSELFLHLHSEIPYSLTVETEEWLVNPNNTLNIKQVIYITKPSQKKIILGKGGGMIKLVGSKARSRIAKFIGQKVNLYLYVKVKEDWQDAPVKD
jgi:GTP-binding protein Era